MNLRAAANSVTRAVNPNTVVQYRQCSGYVLPDDGDGTQIPTYAPDVVIQAQIQNLSFTDLRKLEGLNLQGASYSIYLPGRWSGTVREEGKGSDLMIFRGTTWLVVSILEQWPDWTRVAVTLQNST